MTSVATAHGHDPTEPAGASLLRTMAQVMVAARDAGPIALASAWVHAYDELCRDEWAGSSSREVEAIHAAAKLPVEAAEHIAITAGRSAGLGAADTLVVRHHLAVAPAHIARQIASALRAVRAGNTLATVLPLDVGRHGEPERTAFIQRLMPGAPRYQPGQAVPGRPGWTFASFLGAGAQGEVWCVEHRREGLRQALKLCHDEAAVGQLRREAKNLAVLAGALGEHPYLVRVFAINVESTPPWIAMEVVLGGTLEDWIRDRGPADENVALALWGWICHGMAAAHEVGLVHRDLKPANILLEPDDTPKIADFGIGAVAAPSLVTLATRALSGPALGTDLYASAEQRQGAPPVPADDVHALGVILFQMLVGSTSAAPPHVIARAFESLPHRPSAGTLRLIERCLDTRDHRPVDARDLVRVAAHASLVGGAAQPIAAPRARVRAQPGARRWVGLVWRTVVALVVGLAVLFGWAIMSKPTPPLLRSDGALPSGANAEPPGPPAEVRRTPTGELEIAGFTFLGRSGFTCPNDVDGPLQYRVAIYRCDRLYEAIRDRLAPGDNALDTQFVLLPPDGERAHSRGGSPGHEPGRENNEAYRHVVVPPFLIARTELTQRVFSAADGVAAVASATLGPMNPRERIDWFESAAFCRQHGLRLPSEQEWELACRGGADTAYCIGSALPEDTGAFGEPRDVSRPVASPGGSMNAYGLCDMHGNVWEWCSNVYDTSSSPMRVSRGGGRSGFATWFSRSADREWTLPGVRAPTVGLRPAVGLRGTLPE